MKIARIIVGTDGSENAARAVRWAADLALIADAEVIAVHALGLLTHGEHGTTIPSQSVRDAVEQQLQTMWCEPLAAAGVRHRTELRDGNPVAALLGAADDLNADLVVVGSRGLGGFPQLLLGSTSTQVAQHSTRPVVIVPSHPV